MRRETELLFEMIMWEDRSVVEFLDADYTFVVPLRDRCNFGRSSWLISQALPVTYVPREHRLYLERSCRPLKIRPQQTAAWRGACLFQRG